MQRLFTGLLCFLILYVLCGCAALDNGFSRSSGQESAKQTETKAPAPVLEANQTKVSPVPGTNETKAPSLIPEQAEICRVDSAECVPAIQPVAGAADTPGPVAQIPETSFDFGTMPEDTVFTHKFLIKNVGKSELIIKKVSPS